MPYIYEDRISKEDFIAALKNMYNMAPGERKLLGMKGRQHVVRNYNFQDFNKRWVNLIDSVIEKRGSWETRKDYTAWEFREIK